MGSPSPDGGGARLRWQCRRGLLELDLLLNGFLDKGYARLNAADRGLFEHLLSFPDPILDDWLMGRSVPSDPGLMGLVRAIRRSSPEPPVAIAHQ